MSIPANTPISFYQGDDERLNIIWESPPGTPAADLTAAAIAMHIRNGVADDADIVIEASVGDGITITDGPAATFEIFFSKAKTVLLIGTEDFKYDIQVTPAGGDTKTVLQGDLKFGLEKTRTP